MLALACCLRISLLTSQGKLVILMGDYEDREAGFVPLTYSTKQLAFGAGLKPSPSVKILILLRGGSSASP